MAEYRLYFNTGSSVTVTVEAEDLEAAIDLAYEAIPGGVCAQCSGWGQDWSRDEGEFEHNDHYYEVDGVAVEPKKEDTSAPST